MRHRSILAISASAVLVASTALLTAGASSAASRPAAATAVTQAVGVSPSGSFALSGEAARAYVVPGDVSPVWRASRPDGSTQTRYQQRVGDASVFGGQVTVLEDAAGTTTSVIGAYFPGLSPSNAVSVTQGRARSIVEGAIGTGGTFRNRLLVNPRTGRYFYEVQSLRGDARPVRWVDAGTGRIVKSYSGLTEGTGVGVKGDRKGIDTTRNPSTGVFELRTGDGRQATYDLANRPVDTGGVLMTDADDLWDLAKGTASPSQAAGVDAHYYAGVVDDFYGDVFGRDSLDDQGMTIVSKVHYDRRYCNAYWNGSFMTYGDGDGKTCLPLSGALDVDGHEMTHGVTEFTSNLMYESESGALNESFSDMMGSSLEFYAAAAAKDPAGTPDWLIAEDVIPNAGGSDGFRNMGDPEEFGDPSHYSQRYTGAEDNGGVHTNSGIPNHAYYLAVNGGKNASCAANDAHGVLLTAESCAVKVPALGLGRAQQIFYDAFTGLPSYANFCDARNATVATAADSERSTIGLAWDAVGVTAGCLPGSPPPPPCVGDADVRLPFGSPHPYGNNAGCTWTYDNGTPGFAFHFSLLDTEKDYDYVHVRDAAGNTLATYTGLKRGQGFYGPCIPTATGSVTLTSDTGVVAAGFTVDAVRPC